MCPADSDSDSEDEKDHANNPIYKNDGHSKKHHHHKKIIVNGEVILTNEFHGDPWEGKEEFHTHITTDDDGTVRHWYVLGAIHDPKREKHLWYKNFPIGETYTPISKIDKQASQQSSASLAAPLPPPSAPPPIIPSAPLADYQEHYMRPPAVAPGAPNSPTNQSPLLMYSQFAPKPQTLSINQNNEPEPGCCPPKCSIL